MSFSVLSKATFNKNNSEAIIFNLLGISNLLFIFLNYLYLIQEALKVLGYKRFLFKKAIHELPTSAYTKANDTYFRIAHYNSYRPHVTNECFNYG